MQETALDLIDDLIRCWGSWENEDYLLNTFAPRIVRDSSAVHLLADERAIVTRLKQMLSPEEWSRLPELLRLRRADQLDALESDRPRMAEALERQRAKEEQRQAQLKRASDERRAREEQRLAQARRDDDERRQQKAERQERERKEAEERRRLEEQLRARKAAFKQRAHIAFESDFLKADEHLLQDPDREALSDSEYAALKSRFVQKWTLEELDLELDLQQAAAVAAVDGDVQVVARAGAGKTRTLVARALFLQKHCGVPPGSLLLLAFNKKAATEMSNRLGKVLGGDVPHVMTFHALAYALVHPEEQLIYDEPSAGNLGLSRQIQRVIDEHLQSEAHRPLMRDLMLMHFREDWERIVEGGFDLPIDELISYRKALPRETLKGDYVKSFGERLIANTLFENDIDYEYEYNFRWGGVNYKPDFTILLPDRRGVVVEYFGLKGDRDYDEMSQRKRQFWRQHDGWTMLEYSPSDIASIGEENFATRLIEELAENGVTGRHLSEEELWERIRRRAIDKFTGAIRSFVSRCRKQNLGPEALRHMVERHTSITEAERLFLRLGMSVYADYIRQLSDDGQEDFDGLMWRAVSSVADGQTRFARDKGREQGDIKNLRFVLIDEFQDFSPMFYALSQGIRSVSPKVEFFCVGDDWQAINGFAGSDLSFFEDFGAYFRSTKILNVSTNYRSPARVVQLGNALMTGLGTPAVPDRSDSGWVRTACLSEFAPSASEKMRHGGDEATPAVLRLVKRLLDSGREVVMLARRNAVPWYVSYPPELRPGLVGLERFCEHIRSFLPVEDQKRVTASTAHKYKGLEKQAVIALDVDEGSYPLIHPNWVFLRVFGDSVARIEAEERRLLYVTLTRSMHSLIVLSDDIKRESPYLSDIRSRIVLGSVTWSELAPVPSLDGARLEVRVFNAYDVRDEIRGHYRFPGLDGGKYWWRSVMAEGFDFEALCSQPWAQSGVRIEVYSETGELVNRL